MRLGHKVAGGAKSPTGAIENREFYQGHFLEHSTSDFQRHPCY